MSELLRSFVVFLLVLVCIAAKGNPDCVKFKEFDKCELCVASLPPLTDDDNNNPPKYKNNNSSVTCNNGNLKRIPDSFGGIQKLSIVNDELTILKPLDNCSSLVKLHLNYDGIRLITDGAFNKLNQLEHLNLSHNHITDLNLKTFEGLIKLEMLSLQSNNVYFVEFDVFSDVNQPDLSSLYLNQNKIVKIERRSFEGLSRLVMLDLSMNNIERLEPFASKEKPLANLKILNLGMNKIHEIPEDFFENMPNLEELTLEHNFLTSVSSSDFKFLQNSLKILNLQGNLISDVKSKCFQEMYKLEKVDLSSNHLNQLKSKALPEKSKDPGHQDRVSLSLLIFNNPINCSDCDNSWMARDAVLKEVNPADETLCHHPTTVTFGNDIETLFQHCYSPANAMKVTSVLVFLFILLLLVAASLAFFMLWLRKKRRAHVSLNLGERPGNFATPSNKGGFSYRGLEEQFPFSIDEPEENRL